MLSVLLLFTLIPAESASGTPFLLKAPPGWGVQSDSAPVMLRLSNDWICLDVGPRDSGRRAVEMGRDWGEERQFRAGLLRPADEWSDWSGPSKRRRRLFRSEVGLRQVDACLEADSGDFEARCTALSAVLRTVVIREPAPAADAVLTTGHGLDLAAPLPKGAVVGGFLGLGAPQLKVARQIVGAVLPILVLSERESERKQAARNPDKVTLPGGQVIELPLDEKRERGPLEVASDVLPAQADALHRLSRSLADTLNNVRRVAVASGVVKEDEEAEPPRTVPPVAGVVAEYDGWARSLGGASMYRRTEKERATLIYQFGSERRALVAIDVRERNSELHYRLLWIDGEVEGLVGDLIELLGDTATVELKTDPAAGLPR